MLASQNIGDNESFSSHELFCYYSHLADKLWKVHQAKIDIFTLQGFKRRNKESKTIAKKFYNGKCNVCAQIIN